MVLGEKEMETLVRKSRIRPEGWYWHKLTWL